MGVYQTGLMSLGRVLCYCGGGVCHGVLVVGFSRQKCRCPDTVVVVVLVVVGCAVWSKGWRCSW